ncbi:MAG: hypothetical protein ACK5JO_11580 [Halodesulfovibrio sp.]
MNKGCLGGFAGWQSGDMGATAGEWWKENRPVCLQLQGAGQQNLLDAAPGMT